ncbi:hypothetical protein C4D60_Mb00t17270 [Musa balbisiana]|uniref:Uncharacterized protein n=1 Tax=Musa balbisiana TaxID=52838 RepID=A0A4S8I2K1_MUSBA|nr:hypothetical protein C4D60_Mb00t17270 [Musa balbisiana]
MWIIQGTVALAYSSCSNRSLQPNCPQEDRLGRFSLTFYSPSWDRGRVRVDHHGSSHSRESIHP